MPNSAPTLPNFPRSPTPMTPLRPFPRRRCCRLRRHLRPVPAAPSPAVTAEPLRSRHVDLHDHLVAASRAALEQFEGRKSPAPLLIGAARAELDELRRKSSRPPRRTPRLQEGDVKALDRPVHAWAVSQMAARGLRSKTCQVCRHAERERIECCARRARRSTRWRESSKFIATAIWRHWRDHVSADLKTELFGWPGDDRRASRKGGGGRRNAPRLFLDVALDFDGRNYSIRRSAVGVYAWGAERALGRSAERNWPPHG